MPVINTILQQLVAKIKKVNTPDYIKVPQPVAQFPADKCSTILPQLVAKIM
jgi:hypothetical protein